MCNSCAKSLRKDNPSEFWPWQKKVVFNCKASAYDVKSVLQEVYPKLGKGGGFELLRSGHPSTALVLITPPATGYSISFLRDSAGLGQALAYIRPLRKDIDIFISLEQEVEQVFFVNR